MFQQTLPWPLLAFVLSELDLLDGSPTAFVCLSSHRSRWSKPNRPGFHSTPRVFPRFPLRVCMKVFVLQTKGIRVNEEKKVIGSVRRVFLGTWKIIVDLSDSSFFFFSLALEQSVLNFTLPPSPNPTASSRTNRSSLILSTRHSAELSSPLLSPRYRQTCLGPPHSPPLLLNQLRPALEALPQPSSILETYPFASPTQQTQQNMPTSVAEEGQEEGEGTMSFGGKMVDEENAILSHPPRRYYLEKLWELAPHFWGRESSSDCAISTLSTVVCEV